MFELARTIDISFECLRKHHTTLFYLVSVTIFQLLYLTVDLDSRPYHSSDVLEHTKHSFVAALAVSVPLLYEFSLDQLLAWQNASYGQTLGNHRVADFFVIASVFASGIGFLVADNFSHAIAFLIASGCGCVLLCGLYGRLLSLSYAQWGFSRCMGLMVLFSLSQILSVQSVRVCDNASSVCFQHHFFIAAVALEALCLFLHLLSCRHLVLASHIVAVERKSDNYVVSKYTELVNAAIIALFLTVQLALVSVAAAYEPFGANLLMFELLLLICIAVVAGAKTGRILRFGTMSLKSEIEYKETFVRYISHEIRSPLSTTTLGLDYLLQQMSSKLISYDEALEVIKDAKISADLATSTMNDLLMFDKINSSSFEIFPAITTAWPFIVNCVKPFRTQARVSKLDLSCTIDSREHKKVSVNIDQPKMEQVVRNFLTNAIKFTPAGGALTAEIVVLPGFSNDNPKALEVGDQGVLRFSLKDTGPGISKENLPKLFEQYVQFDANKLQHGSGSGLGLWLSKSIVEMHGGYIGATSQGKNQGCEFYFELPCYSLAPADGTLSNVSLHRSSSHSGHHDTLRPESESSGRVMHLSFGATNSSAPNSRRSVVAMLQPMLGRAGDNSRSRTASRKDSPSRHITPHSSLRNASSGSLTPAQSAKPPSLFLVGSGSELSFQEDAVRSGVTVSRSEHVSCDGDGTAAPIAASTAASVAAVGDAVNAVNGVNAAAGQNRRDLFKPARSVSSISFTSSGSTSYRNDSIEGAGGDAGIAAAQGPEGGGGLKVLLADDSPLSRKMLARTLSDYCARIEHACNGLAALNIVTSAMLARTPFDVVIIDNYMPVMNGADAIAAMRQQGYKGVILAVTGSTAPDIHEHLTSAGADAVILKPLNLQTFKTLMNALMDPSRQPV